MVSGECCHSLSPRWQALISFSTARPIFTLLKASCCTDAEKAGSWNVSDDIRETQMLMVYLHATKQTLIINLSKQRSCQRMHPKSSFPHTKIHQTTRNLPQYPPTLLPPFPSYPTLHCHHTTSKSLSNYPVIHSKPYSPLLFPLMTSIKSHRETTGWTQEPSFSILWVYTSWWNLCGGTITQPPLIFSFLPCGTVKLLCCSFTIQPLAHYI